MTIVPQCGAGFTADLPWFRFYPRDWLSSAAVRRLSLAERGLLMTALAVAWSEGSLPADESALAAELQIPVRELRPAWARVRALFEVRGDRLVHVGLEAERAEQAGHRQRRQGAAAKRWEAARGASNAAALHEHGAGALQVQSTGDAAAKQCHPDPEPDPDPNQDQEHVSAGADTHAPFARFWATYPRKTNRAAAAKAFAALRPDGALLSRMLAAIALHRQSRQWREGVVPHASTWLRQRRWEDELPVSGRNGRPESARPAVSCPHEPACPSAAVCSAIGGA